MLYLESVIIKDLKGISELELVFDLSGERPSWTVVLGDNSTCKTAALRAIALGLCDEASATALMKESAEGYIRRGAKEAMIELSLRRGLAGRTSYKVTTTIRREKTSHGSFEKLVRSSQHKNFPQSEIFVCAYGAGRGTSGTGDISGYANIDSLYNLFNYTEGLQNPELTLRRTDRPTENILVRILEDITNTHEITKTRSGIKASGPWGDGMPLRDLADGYKSTFLWVADLLGWALEFYREIKDRRDICGIVLIDELDQHLHPKWQMTIVERLRNAFPSIQFIATTHSPLVAASIGRSKKTQTDGLYSLEARGERRITSKKVPALGGLRLDQILASQAFDFLLTEDHQEINEVLREASEYASRRSELSKTEVRRFNALRKTIAETQFVLAQTQAERELQRSFLRFLAEENRKLEKELFGK